MEWTTECPTCGWEFTIDLVRGSCPMCAHSYTTVQYGETWTDDEQFIAAFESEAVELPPVVLKKTPPENCGFSMDYFGWNRRSRMGKTVRIYKDVHEYVLTESKLGTEVDVPEDVLNRWNAVLMLYLLMQGEMRDAYRSAIPKDKTDDNH